MRIAALLFLLVVNTAFFSSLRVSAAPSIIAAEEAPEKAGTKLSEKDAYLDLNTGRTFRLIYDGLNEVYNREDLFALDLYVNTRTNDTFWLDDAIVVNNALLRDAAGTYKVDPMKVKRDGNTYKVKIPVVQKTAANAPVPASAPVQKEATASAPAPKEAPKQQEVAPIAKPEEPQARVPAENGKPPIIIPEADVRKEGQTF